MIQLRPYQRQAVDAVYEHLRTRDDHPCVVIPTAGGKTPVMATICRDAVRQWNGRVLILAHVKELLEQSADKLRAICPDVPFGIYSAGLGRRETTQPVIVAGIQSLYRRACELDPFDLVLVDEAHLIAPEGDGMYRQFLSEARVVNPQLRIVGFTATPFRMKTGPICTPQGLLNHVCFEIGVRELIRDGFLCPLITKSGQDRLDFGRLHARGGEFVADEVEALMDDARLVESACDEIVRRCADRRSVLIFASGVRHGQHLVDTLRSRHGLDAGFITGETSSGVRDEFLTRFRSGELRFLVNVNVLTTGFDAPNIDAVALVRPTLSPGLFYQMCGRGFRLHPSKANCLVLDFGGNVLRHGPVDRLEIGERGPNRGSEPPAKECPACRSLIAAGYARCPDCGHEFPPPGRRKHEARATDAGILSGQRTDTEYEVQDVLYAVHVKRQAAADAPRTMRVDYRIGLARWQSEFICFEHTGFAREKAIAWWRRRSPDPVPDTAARAVEIADAGGVAMPRKITVRAIAGEPFDRIVGYDLGPRPAAVALDPADAYDDADIPF